MFSSLIENWLYSLSHFMDQGGAILWWLAAVVAIYWLLVIERLLYLTLTYPKQKANWIAQWQARSDQTSWYAHVIREGWLNQAHQALNQNLNLIKV
ncbi:MotA/TolQ/ExbB proton channel family protein, partial [Photobacterium damselae]